MQTSAFQIIRRIARRRRILVAGVRRLATLVAALAPTVSVTPLRAADSPRTENPNIVIILADDMGWGDPTCYRTESKIPTPNIDTLASEGMRFTDAHTPSAVCSPTRYGLLTGRFCWRTRLKRGVLGWYNAPLIEPDRLTIAKMLKSHGYTTACIGKWHLGMQWATKDPATQLPLLWERKFDKSKIDLAGRITAGPLTAGFDSYFGTAVPNFPPYCFIENDHVLGKIPDRPKPDDMYGDPGLMQEGWDLHKILPGLRDRAVQFIEAQADSGKPFFLYMPLTSPHTPIVPNEPFVSRSRAGDYGALVMEVDAVVGAVMEALKRAGKANDTLVVFTSDNGSPARAGDPHIRGKEWHQTNAVLRMFGHNPNAPWRGMKADIYEGGHRVPLIVRWPGKVAANTANGQLVGLIDWMATIAAVVDHPLPENAAEDSISLLPTLTDPSVAVRENLVNHSGNGMFAIRSGDWKLILGNGSGGWTRIDTSEQPAGQLYDLAADPAEKNNLYLEHPEIVAQLTGRLNRYRSSGRSTPKQIHVSVKGNDSNDGSASRPLRTISAAARSAQPGDAVTVHAGVYRERVAPPRGGESDATRIVYQAAPGEKVVIKGSEVIKGWKKVQNDTWRVEIPNSLFGDFNPYSDLIHGDWFNRKGRDHHTGAVYLNDHWLTEAAQLDDVMKPIGDTPFWFGQVADKTTTIWAQFKGIDPNKAGVEINVRQSVFYPEKPGINYITVRGFTMMHAATPWAPPTAEQIGLIGTHWSKGWIIENNDIRYSTCAGIALGKYGDQWDNTSQNTATGYVKTIERALENGWSKENIGHHIVRNNHIAHCEQAGVVGSLGAVFSTITGNVIHDIHVRRLFSGAEMAGIKIHAAIDTLISNNHIYRTTRGIWLDWMAQGTRVTRNLMHDNDGSEDLFVEVDHGPFMVDHNLFLSKNSLRDWSEGGAFVHNLFTGSIVHRSELRRETPYQKAHSTEVAGLRNIQGGDHRFYNNIFAGGDGLATYDKATLPMQMAGNVFLKGARPSTQEQEPLLRPDFDPELKLVEGEDGVELQITLENEWRAERSRQIVTTERLGRATVPDLPFERPNGMPYRLDTDYFGRPLDSDNPFPGPFEIQKGGKQVLKVWPIASR